MVCYTSSWIAKKNNLKPVSSLCSKFSTEDKTNKKITITTKRTVMGDGKASLSEILGMLLCWTGGETAMPPPSHLGNLHWGPPDGSFH